MQGENPTPCVIKKGIWWALWWQNCPKISGSDNFCCDLVVVIVMAKTSQVWCLVKIAGLERWLSAQGNLFIRHLHPGKKRQFMWHGGKVRGKESMLVIELQEGKHDHEGVILLSWDPTCSPAPCPGLPHTGDGDLLDAEDEDGARMSWGWSASAMNDRVGVVQPGQEEPSSLLEPEGFTDGKGLFTRASVIGWGRMASNWKKANIRKKFFIVLWSHPLFIEKGTPWWTHCTPGIRETVSDISIIFIRTNLVLRKSWMKHFCL